MTDENYQKSGDNGVGGAWNTGDSLTAAILTEIEKRVDDELKKFKAAIQGDGVISGLAVTEKGAGADQSVDVASGSCSIGGTKYTEAGTVNVALDAADGTYARWDIITYDASASDPSKVTGVAGAIPTIPDVPSGDIILALVLRAANDNVITNAEITDKRIVAAMRRSIYDTTGDGYTKRLRITASDDLKASDDTIESNAGDLVKLKEFTVTHDIDAHTSAVLRIKFDLRAQYEDAPSAALGRIYKNGVAHGTLRSYSGTTFANQSEDISDWKTGDTIELWVGSSGNAGLGYVQNFRVYGAVTAFEGVAFSVA